jgi:hypothetical protein
MDTLKKVIVYILAAIGFVSVVKHIHISRCKEGCCLCNKFKTKEEGSRTKAEVFKTKVEGFKTKAEGLKAKVEGFKSKVYESKAKVQESEVREEGEKRTGTRYGSNPLKY